MIRSALVSIASRAAAAVLNFGTMVLLSRYLGAEGKGISSKIIVLIAGIQVMADFFGGAALVYLSSRYPLLKLLKPAWIWTLFCSLIAGIVLSTWGNLTQYGLHLGALAFLCSTLQQHIHLINGRARFKDAIMLNMLQAILIFMATWWFLHIEPDPLSYICGLYAGWGLPWILSLLILSKLSPGPTSSNENSSAARQLFRFGSANQVGHLIQYFTQRIAFFMLPAVSLGIYSNAITLSESMWMVASGVAMVQYGSISNHSDRNQAASLSLVFMKMVLMVTAAGGLILCLLPERLFIELFGQEFKGVAELLPVLYPGICFMSAYLIIGHYFSGTGKFRNNNYALLTGMFISLVSYLAVLIIFRGISMFQVAAITSLANGAIFFSVLWLFLKDSGIRAKELIPCKKDWNYLMLLFRERNTNI
jgi:O-antigen/teichoic acid export membrane protein